MPETSKLKGSNALPRHTAIVRLVAYALEYPDGTWSARLTSAYGKAKYATGLLPPLPEALALQIFPAYQAIPKPYKDSLTLEEI